MIKSVITAAAVLLAGLTAVSAQDAPAGSTAPVDVTQAGEAMIPGTELSVQAGAAITVAAGVGLAAALGAGGGGGSSSSTTTTGTNP